MDNMIVSGDDLIEREALKWCLAKKFKIKQLGRLKYFYQIEVDHSKGNSCQENYVLDLLHKKT